jgi:ABC-type dipeptide/oligopeptide/nickel transport system ATPase subunit
MSDSMHGGDRQHIAFSVLSSLETNFLMAQELICQTDPRLQNVKI